MDDVEHIDDVEHVVEELTRTQNELQRVLGQLADSQLQLGDVRTERNHENERADQEHQTAAEMRRQLAAANELTAQAQQRLSNILTKLADSTTIGAAEGIIAEKAGVPVGQAHHMLSSYSRKHEGRRISDVAAEVVAEHEKRTPAMETIDAIILGIGVPQAFWDELTLNGAIFEDNRK
jgi:vacuolar-type H+-ATPase subunit I/STV1